EAHRARIFQKLKLRNAVELSRRSVLHLSTAALPPPTSGLLLSLLPTRSYYFAAVSTLQCWRSDQTVTTANKGMARQAIFQGGTYTVIGVYTQHIVVYEGEAAGGSCLLAAQHDAPGLASDDIPATLRGGMCGRPKFLCSRPPLAVWRQSQRHACSRTRIPCQTRYCAEKCFRFA